jgi:hypothetical protein
VPPPSPLEAQGIDYNLGVRERALREIREAALEEILRHRQE